MLLRIYRIEEEKKRQLQQLTDAINDLNDDKLKKVREIIQTVSEARDMNLARDEIVELFKEDLDKFLQKYSANIN